MEGEGGRERKRVTFPSPYFPCLRQKLPVVNPLPFLPSTQDCRRRFQFHLSSLYPFRAYRCSSRLQARSTASRTRRECTTRPCVGVDKSVRMRVKNVAVHDLTCTDVHHNQHLLLLQLLLLLLHFFLSSSSSFSSSSSSFFFIFFFFLIPPSPPFPSLPFPSLPSSLPPSSLLPYLLTVIFSSRRISSSNCRKSRKKLSRMSLATCREGREGWINKAVLEWEKQHLK